MAFHVLVTGKKNKTKKKLLVFHSLENYWTQFQMTVHQVAPSSIVWKVWVSRLMPWVLLLRNLSGTIFFAPFTSERVLVLNVTLYHILSWLGDKDIYWFSMRDRWCDREESIKKYPVQRMETICPCQLNYGFDSKLLKGYQLCYTW